MPRSGTGSASAGPRGAVAPGSAADAAPPRRSRRQLASAAAAAAAASRADGAARAPAAAGEPANPLPLAADAAAAAALPFAGAADAAPAVPPPPPPPPDDWFANDVDDDEYIAPIAFGEFTSAGLSLVNSVSSLAYRLSPGAALPPAPSAPAPADRPRPALGPAAIPAASRSLVPRPPPGYGPRSALAPSAPGGQLPTFGLDGAPAIGARGVDYYVPGAGGAGRTESAFATPVVARLLHSSTRLERFGLPPGLRNPGVFPQPFAMFGEFLHRFPTEDRSVFEARVLRTALSWLQNAHNRLIDVEDRVANGIYTASDAAEAIPVSRAHVHRVFALLATRYECLREARSGGGDWAHTLEAIALQPAGPGYSNPATAAIHASAASARFTAAARAHGQHLARSAAPRPPPNPSRRREAERIHNPRRRPGGKGRGGGNGDGSRNPDNGRDDGGGRGRGKRRIKRPRSPRPPRPAHDGGSTP